MATILFTWELGGGLGHLMQMGPLVEGLAAKGHRVVAALKDLARPYRIFGRGKVMLLQAPMRVRLEPRPFKPSWIFAQILHNIGFSDGAELGALGEAWRHLYGFVRPDLIVFDHSPTALLAARGLPVKRVVLGSGFCVPPDQAPMPNLRPWSKPEMEKLWPIERGMLERMNRVLAGWRVPPMERVTQMYGEVDETLLLTFAELDHYGAREGARYWGAWTRSEGKKPEWPSGRGKRVYAYLKPFAAIPGLLRVLKERGNPTIVVSDGIPMGLQQRFAGETMRFENQPLDMAAVSQECEVAILNAGHGTTTAMLLAGRPVLAIPLQLEQALLGRAVQRLGAGLAVAGKALEPIERALDRLLNDEQFARAAEGFAAKYAGFDAEEHRREVLRRVEEVLGGRREVAGPMRGLPFSVGGRAITR